MTTPNYSPLWQLTLARLREFFRVPEAVFWVYGFPLLMAVALGIAFREQPVEEIHVDVQHGSTSAQTEALEKALSKDQRLKVKVVDEAEGLHRLERGKTDLVVVPGLDQYGQPKYEYKFQASRPGGTLARSAVDSVLVRAAVGASSPTVTEKTIEAPGSRYIDFLIPGLIGMNLMGGGLWGVGFVIVDLRTRKLLKRFLATPMRKTDFLFSLMLSRMIFTVPEVLVLLIFGWLVFGVSIGTDFLSLLFVIVLGAVSFSGLGLLIACRAKTIETISGLMNLVMLPMFLFSGVFFSSDRFPDVIQPFVQALPLTALNNALRGIMLDGESLLALGPELAILGAWGGVSYVLALRWFRWL